MIAVPRLAVASSSHFLLCEGSAHLSPTAAAAAIEKKEWIRDDAEPQPAKDLSWQRRRSRW
ncbi:MAG: hypothetical protein WC483_00265 [Candidatus Paceibacterota bacterium]